MSNHEQLLKDLNMQAQSKLAQWVKDTIDLYEMAGVSAREALTTMSSEMIFMTINMLADCTVMTPEQFGRAMQESFEKRVAKNTRLKFEYLHPAMTEEHLGLLPEFLDPKDPRPARAQLHEHYAHGGGWRPLSGLRLSKDNVLMAPGDPPFKPLAQAKLRDELIVLYEADFVAVIQPDRSFEVARMD